MLSRLSPTKGVPGEPRGSNWRQIPHPASLVITQVKKSLIWPSHPYLPTPTTFHFLPPNYLFNPDFSLLPILYLLSLSSVREWTGVIFGGKTSERSSFYNGFSENVVVARSSFILLLSGEVFTTFSINNRTNFFGEKKVKWIFPKRQLLFENTRKNLVLILILVLKSKALYYSQTEAHWFSDSILTPQKLTKTLGLWKAWISWITLCSLQVFLFF